MNVLKFTAVTLIMALSLISCGGGGQPANAEGFGAIQDELNDKFGEDAYYTDLKILYVKSFGSVINTTVTEDPESLKMGEWNLTKGSWNQESEITLEVSDGSKAADFMFQLDDTVNLSKLGALVEKSIEQLKTEKNIENPVLSIAFIKFPKNGDMAKTEYAITLEPENGGTSFSFYYTLDGELRKMDY